MRVFLDTNVLVSAFTTRGLSEDVFRLVMTEHELVTGEVVLVELRRVLIDRFGVPRSDAEEIERLLRRFPVEAAPDSEPEIAVRDPDDVWILASAIAAQADVLITGDRDLLDIAESVSQLVIVSPRGFWEMMRAT